MKNFFIISTLLLLTSSVSYAWKFNFNNATPLDGTFKAIYNTCTDDTRVVGKAGDGTKRNFVTVNAYECRVKRIEGTLWDPIAKKYIQLTAIDFGNWGERDFRGIKIYDTNNVFNEKTRTWSKDTTPNYRPNYIMEVMEYGPRHR